MKKSLFFSLLCAAALTACNSGSDENKYTASIVCTFDYTEANDMTGGKGYYCEDSFQIGNILSFNNLYVNNTFYGGCALVGLTDDVLEEGHIADPMCVFGKGVNDSPYYLTVKVGNNMPEHLIDFIQKDYGTMYTSKCYFNNTNQLVTIATYGLPAADNNEAIPAFQEGDYFKVRIYATSGKVRVSERYVEFTLAEYTGGKLDVCKEWKEVDLTSLGTVEALDVELLSDRRDLPPYFCIDNLAVSASITM